MNSRHFISMLSLLCVWQLDLELNEEFYQETPVAAVQQFADNVSDVSEQPAEPLAE